LNCPNCHQPVAGSAKFCGSCGKPIAASPLPADGSSEISLRPLEPAAATAGASGPRLDRTAGHAAPSVSATHAASLIDRIKNILFTPKIEWPVIEPEPTSIGALYIGYVAPLAALAALIAFVHMSIIGVSIPFAGTMRMPFMSGLTSLVMTFVGGFIGLFIVGIIINAFAPTFGGTRDLRQALKTAAYAFTPAWISSIFGLLPALGTLLQFIAGCYGIYLLYLGLPIMMRARRESAGGYTATVVVCTIVLGFVFGAVMAVVGGSTVALSGAFGHTAASGMQSKEEARERGAATVGNVIGDMLGTDDKGKSDIGSAVAKLAKAGEESQSNSQSSSTSASTTSDSSAGSEKPQDAVAAAGGLLSALGGALGGKNRVDPVDFRTLKDMLPGSLPGLQRTNATGETKQGLGMKASNATGTYRGASGETVEIEISDMSAISGLMDVAESLPQTTESDGTGGYEKDVTIGGHSAHEKFDNSTHHGEVQTIVAKRFEVDVSGDNVDMRKLESYLGSVDLSKLESMKAANPK
jgi:hypothetical protein